jgi:hypothetical protein
MAGMKSRWFRFSLRTLLLVIAVLCVWLGIQVNAARRQKEAVAAIQKAGGEINFDFQCVPVGSVRNLVSASRKGLSFVPFFDKETDAWMHHYSHEPSS